MFQEACTRKVRAVLFIEANTPKMTQRSLTEEWINKSGMTEDVELHRTESESTAVHVTWANVRPIIE